jgi:plasmid stabilization system protein ParE
MSYTVNILPRAERDFEEIYGFILERSPQGAVAWAKAFHQALKQLEKSPTSHALAPESGDQAPELRQLIFKTRRGNAYRALFTIEEDQVYVHHIRGSGRDLITP